jgi:hypothetical protein
MWSCFSQKAFRLFLVAGREDVGACIGEFWSGTMRVALSRTILNYNNYSRPNRRKAAMVRIETVAAFQGFSLIDYVPICGSKGTQ